MKKIYVGNLSWSTNEDTLKTSFAEFGEVQSVTIIRDRHTGRSRGFGFVEMENDDAASEAISKLNETELEGRKLTVNEARPPKERSGGRSGGGRGDFRGGQGRRF